MRGTWSVALAAWSFVALCLQPAVARSQDQRATARDVGVFTGRVEKVDRFSRSVTLRTAEGLQHTVYVGPELKVFDELKAGDTVSARVSESVVVAVRPNAKLTAIEDSTAAAKKSPEASAADVLQQLKAVVKIESIDQPHQVITYKTADNRNVMRQVGDPRLLEGLKRGDTIEITYTRERAIEITKNR